MRKSDQKSQEQDDPSLEIFDNAITYYEYQQALIDIGQHNSNAIAKALTKEKHELLTPEAKKKEGKNKKTKSKHGSGNATFGFE